MEIRRGDIVLVNLDPVVGSEQGKTRPALVIQNNVGNQSSPTTIVAPITKKIYSNPYPTNMQVSRAESGLDAESTILFNQIRTIDKIRVVKKLSILRAERMKEANRAIAVSLGLDG